MTIGLDVADVQSVKSLIAKTIESFFKIKVTVANAGVTIRKPFLELTEADYDKVMDVNAKCVFFCSQEAARHMVKQKQGSIVHISSTTSVIAEPNTVEHGASKVR